MSAETRSIFPFVGIDGQPLRDSLRHDIVEVLVEDHLVFPDSFSIRFRDDRQGQALWTELGVRIGQTMEIRSGELGESSDATLIKGEITAIEAVFDHGTRYLVVRGFDALHRLHTGRKTRSFNDMTDSDLARRIASDAGLEIGSIASTSISHPHVSQINTTDWEFLRSRAREIGFKFAVVDGRFEFGPASDSSTSPVELTVGENLVTFRTRVTGAQQVERVKVLGWDPAAKDVISREMDTETKSVELSDQALAPARLAETLGGAELLKSDLPIGTAAEVDAVAAATVEEVASSFSEADGTAEGSPRLVTGALVKIKGAGPFDGEYVISHSRHRFDDDGYHTDFEVAGSQDRSLLGLTSLGAVGRGAPPIHGAVVAIVTDARDPEGIGRVKVKFPWLGDEYESYWARVATPGAGSERGFHVVPEVGDEVLVMFERGDMRSPYVIGGLYNGQDVPPSDAVGGNGRVVKRTWRSRQGHRIELTDDPEGDSIEISTGDDGYTIKVSQTDDEITIVSKGMVAIESRRDIELKSDSNVKISGVNVTVEATGNLELTGANTKVEGSGQAEIKGGVVRIN